MFLFIGRSTPSEYVSVDLTKDDEDVPVDLSCPSRQSRVESIPLEKENLDEEALKDLSIETKDDLRRYITKLQAELRIEEVNLILLQKIKLSHQKDHKSCHDSNGIYAEKQHYGHPNSQSKHQSGKMQNGAVPKKGSQAQQQGKCGGPATANAKGSSVNQHSTQNSSRSTSGNHSSQASSRYQPQSTFQVNGTSHQQSSQVQQLQLHEQQRKLLQQQQQAAAALVEQTAARRLAAAKLVVQKNLERDLIRTPGPRASPFDLSVVPNPSCPQFISLVGLEQAVDRLLTNENLKRDVAQAASAEIVESKAASLLISCARCSTDFTPKWVERTGKTGAKVYWCEHCHRMERKRAASKHQEEKLNSAFAKAAQQEREMEKALAAELEAAKQQLDAIILPNPASASFRAAPVVQSARNSPAPGTSRSNDKQTAKVASSSPASQLTSLQKQQAPQKQFQQKSSRLPQTAHNTKSVLSPHVHQQPPLDLERLMLYNEKMGAMFKQLASSTEPSTSLFKDRSLVKQNVSGSRHTPYSRP